MSTPTAMEQELLEMINRARANPQGEFNALITNASSKTGVTQEVTDALNYFGVDLDSFRKLLSAEKAAAPLAWNNKLAVAAEKHSKLLIEADAQSHQLPGEKGLGDRARAEGYTGFQAVSENVYSYSHDAAHAHAGFFIDWGYDAQDVDGSGRLLSDWKTRGDGIQDPSGHRDTILSSNRTLTEVGIGAIAVTDASKDVGPWVITQDFGHRFDYRAQVVGVVFKDGDKDNFYDAGEGMGGVQIEIYNASHRVSTTSWSSGGYQVELPPGSYTVSFKVDGTTAPILRKFTMGSGNTKVDLNLATATPAPTEPDATVLTGTSGNDWLTVLSSHRRVDGGAGVDMLSFQSLSARVEADLGAGDATSGRSTWALNRIENLTGTSFGDLLIGDSGNNRLRGMGDYDWFVGSAGRDTYEGGTGRDMIAYSSATAGVQASLEARRGLGGQANGDTYLDVEGLTGSSYGDRLTGDSAANILRGMAGDDFLFGGAGRDRLEGGRGHDKLYGGADGDRLTGGAGNDLIDGGAGWDTAIYAGNRSDFRIETRANGTTIVRDTTGAEGTDTLLRVEVLEFADGFHYLA